MHRRTVLQGLGGLGLLPMQSVWPRGGLDLDLPEDRLTAIAKMRGATDDRLVMGWVIGARYAVVDHQAIPMLGILAATFSRYRRVDEQSFNIRSLEVAYFTDLETEKLIETWENPVTGKRVEVPQTRMGPSSITMTAEGLDVETVGEARGMRLDHYFRKPIEHGNEVWITEEIRVNGKQANSTPFIYNEMSTYQARRQDLNDPSQASVPTRVQFQSLVTFRPWMGFGDTSGHTTARGIGWRAPRVEDLPPYYLELTEKYHPDVLNDPLGVLAGEES